MKKVFVVSIISGFASIAQAHSVYAWTENSGSTVLWNRESWESVEHVCNSLDRPVNKVGMCAKGNAGWKCLALYENRNCTGKSHHDHVNYLMTSCPDGRVDINHFDVSFTTDFWGYGVTTYDC